VSKLYVKPSDSSIHVFFWICILLTMIPYCFL